ncbi:MAG: hypothetical protein J6386_16705 [Candidatus Synoicihabitans palmerolidicus]|nr:hypothetical protein [Candidatus Synoicihabitans palmerolidicus]
MVTPRAALLGTLAGVSITFISMRPALQMFLTPTIGLVCFAILLVNWFGGVRFFKGLPAGCIALAAGTLIAWGSNLFDLNYGGLTLQGLTESFTHFGFRIPLPAIGHTFSGFEYLGVLLVTAIPFSLYDFVEAIDNVESAAAAGDSFPTTRVLVADGVISMVGCLMGNPFILAVYIDHPEWKAMGGRCGSSFATGAMVIILCWFGIVSVMLAAILIVAILPIWLYIGMLIGSQAFQETPRRHAPAIILAIVPHIAHWATGMITGALTSAGVTEGTPEIMTNLGNEGVMLPGLHILGGGTVLTGIILAAMTVFIIERQLWRASIFAAASAVLTFFGFMHGEHIGIAQIPAVAIGYVMVAIFLAGCAKCSPVTPIMIAHGSEEETEEIAPIVG